MEIKKTVERSRNGLKHNIKLDVCLGQEGMECFVWFTIWADAGKHSGFTQCVCLSKFQLLYTMDRYRSYRFVIVTYLV